MNKERTLLDIIDPIVKIMIGMLLKQEEAMQEIQMYIRTLPKTEFTPEKLEKFLTELGEKVAETIPPESSLSKIKPAISEIVRMNFLMGFQAGRSLNSSYKENYAK